jgi:2-polyprenyl-3-methyl-5-hydroxy-6-metoxy-1,4-benzoquinol methylase
MTDPSPYSGHEFVLEGSNDSWSNLFTFIPEGARVLDVGCSTGNFGEALERIRGCEVVGIDIFENDVEVARTRITRAEVRDVTVAADLADLGTFDVVVFADVLEHLVDPRAALRSCASILAPGGTVLYSIPNMGHLSVRLDLLAGRFGYTEVGILDHTHVHFYDTEAVDSLFADCGFTITDERPVRYGYPPAWIESTLDDLGLTGDARFAAMLDATEADILQMVGRAVPSGTDEADALTLRTRTFPPEELHNYMVATETENHRLHVENQSLQQARDEVTAALADERAALAQERHRAESFEQQLAAVQDRLTRLRTHPVRTVADQLTKRLRGRTDR